MLRTIIPALLLAGCVQLPPTPEDIQAKRFETPPGKSVIYIARMRVDSDGASGLVLDDRSLITTYRGTYYRWEVDPGTHKIEGFGQANERVTLTTAPGQVYFLQHTVLADRDDGAVIHTALQQVDDRTGRRLVTDAVLLR